MNEISKHPRSRAKNGNHLICLIRPSACCQRKWRHDVVDRWARVCRGWKVADELQPAWYLAVNRRAAEGRANQVARCRSMHALAFVVIDHIASKNCLLESGCWICGVAPPSRVGSVAFPMECPNSGDVWHQLRIARQAPVDSTLKCNVILVEEYFLRRQVADSFSRPVV